MPGHFSTSILLSFLKALSVIRQYIGRMYSIDTVRFPNYYARIINGRISTRELVVAVVVVLVSAPFFSIIRVKHRELSPKLIFLSRDCISYTFNYFFQFQNIICCHCSKIVLVAVQDEGSKYAGSAVSALKKLGAKDPVQGTLRSSFALVGYAGASKQAWIKQEWRPRRSGPSEITEKIPLSSSTLSLFYSNAHHGVGTKRIGDLCDCFERFVGDTVA